MMYMLGTGIRNKIIKIYESFMYGLAGDIFVVLLSCGSIIYILGTKRLSVKR